MRTVQLHPFSLLIGAAVSVLAFVAMGQQVVPNGQVPPRGEYAELLQRSPAFAVNPSDWIQIVEGTPYVVPSGKVLAIRGLGSNGDYSGGPNYLLAQLKVDGQYQAGAPTRITEVSGGGGYGFSYGNGTSMKLLPMGLSIPGGSTVEVEGGGNNLDARAWGFLADA